MASRSQEPPSTTASAPKSKTRKTSTKSAESANAAAFNMESQDDLRLKWIAEAAYFIAERRGFSGGSPSDDWLEAEAEIDRMLAGTRH